MLRRITWFVVLAGLLAMAQPALASGAVHAEIDPRIWQELADAPSAHWLVRLREPAAALTALANSANANEQVAQRVRQVSASQEGLRAQLTAEGIAYRAYWLINVVAVAGDRALLERLAARPDVLAIESDRPFRVPLETADLANSPNSPTTPEPGLTLVHAPELWALGIKGSGIVVASADTGVIWDHPALKAHYRGWNGTVADHNYNWWDAIHPDPPVGSNPCGYALQAPCDDFSPTHGTHTTGTMVGVEVDGLTNQIGMAPAAQWIACRNMNNGFGQPSTYIECLQFFVAPTDLSGNNRDATKRPHIINNSYGCPSSEGCVTDSLRVAVQQVRAAGIFMAVSAGNSGPNCGTISDPPALEAGVFTVGNVDSSLNIYISSSRGPALLNGAAIQKPDLVAPGVSVRSALGGGYGSLTGTSMAAPHVAGAVALLWSAFPALQRDIDATEKLLRWTTSAPLPYNQTCGGIASTVTPNYTFGWGVLNVLKAYQRWQNNQSPYLKMFIPQVNYQTLPHKMFIPQVIQ
jgi:subtilisin family serine protease